VPERFDDRAAPPNKVKESVTVLPELVMRPEFGLATEPRPKSVGRFFWRIPVSGHDIRASHNKLSNVS
jgi:hypothetical protein